MLDSVAVEEDAKHERFAEEAPTAADAGAAAETCYLSGATSKKRSAVWTYYQDDEDGNKALCLICLENIQHRRNTSNLLKHLRKRHPAEYADVEDRTKRRQVEDGVIATPPCAFKHQTTLQSTCRNATKYPGHLSPTYAFSVCFCFMLRKESLALICNGATTEFILGLCRL